MKQLTGEEVSRISFDFSVFIEFTSGASVRLETKLLVKEKDLDRSVTLHPEALDANAILVLNLLRERVSSSSIEKDGALTIEFSNGTRLTSPPDTDYESWTITLPSGQSAICMPGGEVALW